MTLSCYLNRKAQISLTKIDAEDSRWSSSVGDVRLACTSLDRELQLVLKEKEELVLAESLRKLEVQQRCKSFLKIFWFCYFGWPAGRL